MDFSNFGLPPEDDLPELVARLRALADSLEMVARKGPHRLTEHCVMISDWTVAKRAVPILVGRMRGHPTIRDGSVGATTEIYFFDQGSGLIRTFNRWYRLTGPLAQNKDGLQ